MTFLLCLFLLSCVNRTKSIVPIEVVEVITECNFWADPLPGSECGKSIQMTEEVIGGTFGLEEFLSPRFSTLFSIERHFIFNNATVQFNGVVLYIDSSRESAIVEPDARLDILIPSKDVVLQKARFFDVQHFGDYVNGGKIRIHCNKIALLEKTKRIVVYYTVYDSLLYIIVTRSSFRKQGLE